MLEMSRLSQSSQQRYEDALLDKSCSFPLLFAHYLAATTSASRLVELIYEEALKTAPDDASVLCAYADFLYYTAGDIKRAARLYEMAVDADQGADATALATYAHFLFQSESAGDSCACDDGTWDVAGMQLIVEAATGRSRAGSN